MNRQSPFLNLTKLINRSNGRLRYASKEKISGYLNYMKSPEGQAESIVDSIHLYHLRMIAGESYVRARMPRVRA